MLVLPLLACLPFAIVCVCGSRIFFFSFAIFLNANVCVTFSKNEREQFKCLKLFIHTQKHTKSTHTHRNPTTSAIIILYIHVLFLCRRSRAKAYIYKTDNQHDKILPCYRVKIWVSNVFLPIMDLINRTKWTGIYFSCWSVEQLAIEFLVTETFVFRYLLLLSDNFKIIFGYSMVFFYSSLIKRIFTKLYKEKDDIFRSLKRGLWLKNIF